MIRSISWQTERIPALLALSFLTRIPVPHLARVEKPDFGRSALYYPLVGLLIGGLLCVFYGLFAGANAWLLAAVLMVAWVMITGGLHLDGLADSADAWLGGLGDTEKTHRILKDPLVGSAGVIAIVAVLLLKFAALGALLQSASWLGILLAPIIGRSLILLLFLTTDYVRATGLASNITEYLPRQPAAWIVVSVGLLALLYSFAGLLWVALGFWALRRLMLQRLGGCTGDTAGAMVEIGEVLWLVGVGLFTAA